MSVSTNQLPVKTVLLHRHCIQEEQIHLQVCPFQPSPPHLKKQADAQTEIQIEMMCLKHSNIVIFRPEAFRKAAL